MAGPLFNHDQSTTYLREHGVNDLRKLDSETIASMRNAGVPNEVIDDILAVAKDLKIDL